MHQAVDALECSSTAGAMPVDHIRQRVRRMPKSEPRPVRRATRLSSMSNTDVNSTIIAAWRSWRPFAVESTMLYRPQKMPKQPVGG